MKFLAHVPGPPLSAFVELFWLYEGYDPGHPRERLLPTGTTELVFDLDDKPMLVAPRDGAPFESFRGPLVCGVHAEPFVIDTSEPAAVLGVHFKPGGAYPFLPVPADETLGRHLSLEALWGPRSRALKEEVLNTPTAAGKFAVLERWLLAIAWRPLERHPAVGFALARFLGGTPVGGVGKVADRVGLSRRRFIEAFRTEVGLAPKLFCRIQRFQEVLAQIEGQRRVAWAAVAQTCGYFDQAHFIHDFRAFSGLNPTEFLAVRGEHRNHIPLSA
jgi:AraC-like DNA-binding protein